MGDNSIYSSSFKLHKKYADHKVYYLDASSDKGVITAFKICPGIYVTYNDFFACNYINDFNPSGEDFCIDYCKMGRLDWEDNKGSFGHIDAGYVYLHNRKDLSKYTSLLTENYSGITVYINFLEIKFNINQCFLFFDIDIEKLRQHVFAKSDSIILPSEKKIQKAFEEIYSIKSKIDFSMLRIRVIEILSYISKIQIKENSGENLYFRHSQIEKVSQIKEYLCANTERRVTLEDLSHKFDISLKALKLCFKQQYGQSVYAFSKDYRLHKAAELLKATDNSILEVGNLVGYSSPSKFSKAFKDKFGITPLKFKKM